MKVFVSGFMAAGKTTVGRELALRLDLPFVDLDEWTERRAAKTVAEIFATAGEEAFRQLESRELARVIELEAAVTALGGGTLLRRENLERVRRAGTLVWLDTPRSTILSRLPGSGATRPLWSDAERAARLFDERLPTYRQCDLRVRPRTGEPACEVAARIARRIKR